MLKKFFLIISIIGKKNLKNRISCSKKNDFGQFSNWSKIMKGSPYCILKLKVSNFFIILKNNQENWIIRVRLYLPDDPKIWKEHQMKNIFLNFSQWKLVLSLVKISKWLDYKWWSYSENAEKQDGQTEKSNRIKQLCSYIYWATKAYMNGKGKSDLYFVFLRGF